MPKKRIKRLLLWGITLNVLVVCFMLSGFKANASQLHNPVDTNGDFVGYSYIWFGSYPQSELDETKDASLIAQIDGKIGIDKTGDCWIDGIKYRKLNKADCDTNGRAWENKNYRYFKWERIKWRVLKADNIASKALVMTDKAIEFRRYNTTYTCKGWERCTLRSWLNGYERTENDNLFDYSEVNDGFYTTAFSATEKGKIAKSKITSEAPSFSDYLSYATEEDITDSIFILTKSEFLKEEYGFKSDTALKFTVTDYSANPPSGSIYLRDFSKSGGKGGNAGIMSIKDGSFGEDFLYMYEDCAFYIAPAMIVSLNMLTDENLSDDGGSGYGGEEAIRYELNGGVNASSNPGGYRPGVGVDSFAAPSKAGCVFEGWYSDSSFTYKINSISKESKGEVTLYAKWKKNKVSNPFTVSDVTQNISKKSQTINLYTAMGNIPSGTSFKYKVNVDDAKNTNGIAISGNGVLSVPAKAYGTIKITVTAEENADYVATTREISVTLIPDKVKGLKVAGAGKKGSVKISWKANDLADGYEVKCSASSSFPKGKKTKTAKVGKKATSCVIKGMSVGKKCYVQIRAYKKVGKTTFYSPITKGSLKKVK